MALGLDTDEVHVVISNFSQRQNKEAPFKNLLHADIHGRILRMEPNRVAKPGPQIYGEVVVLNGFPGTGKLTIVYSNQDKELLF